MVKDGNNVLGLLPSPHCLEEGGVAPMCLIFPEVLADVHWPHHTLLVLYFLKLMRAVEVPHWSPHALPEGQFHPQLQAEGQLPGVSCPFRSPWAQGSMWIR